MRTSFPKHYTLRVLGETFRQRLQDLPDITHTKLSISPAAPKVAVRLNEEKLRRLGLERTQVADLIDGYLRGRFGGAVMEDTEQLPVRARLQRDAWQNSDSLMNLQIPLPRGSGAIQFVPLSTLGELSIVPDDSPIGRRDGERAS